MVLHTLTYVSRKLIGIGVPGGTPTLRHHFLTVDIHLHITTIIKDKLIVVGLSLAFAAALGLDKTLIDDVGTHQIHTLRKILDTAVIRLQGYLRLLGGDIFVIDRILIAHQLLALGINVGTCQVTFLTVLIVELERTVQLQIVVGITETAIRIRIPQQTIVLVGEHKGDRHLRIILEEILVLTLHVKFLTLMLSEAIESLILW